MGCRTAFLPPFPLNWIEHIPEFRIGKVGKLFSENWSLPGQEQQLSVRRQMAQLIRARRLASCS